MTTVVLHGDAPLPEHVRLAEAEATIAAVRAVAEKWTHIAYERDHDDAETNTLARIALPVIYEFLDAVGGSDE